MVIRCVCVYITSTFADIQHNKHTCHLYRTGSWKTNRAFFVIYRIFLNVCNHYHGDWDRFQTFWDWFQCKVSLKGYRSILTDFLKKKLLKPIGLISETIWTQKKKCRIPVDLSIWSCNKIVFILPAMRVGTQIL